MTDPIAESTVQDALVARLTQPDLGWTFVDPDDLPRELEDVILESEVVAALKRLNPEIASHPERVDEVMPQIRATLRTVTNDGLLATNEQMVAWLCGRKTVSYTGETDFLPVRLIDFDNPRANQFIDFMAQRRHRHPRRIREEDPSVLRPERPELRHRG